MKPELNMERWTKWSPIPVRGGVEHDSALRSRPARRPRRSPSRRTRSEATRTMLEMLRALAQTETSTLEQAGAMPYEPIEVFSPQRKPGGLTDEPRRAELAEGPARASSPDEPSGLMLLRSKMFGPEPEDTELHCRYCNRLFKLQDGGASFEGNAACSSCEQHLNREFVLPAVSKHRPQVYPAGEVPEGPGHPKQAAWARPGAKHHPAESAVADGHDATEDVEVPEENLQEV